jgi:hypothetical protein
MPLAWLPLCRHRDRSLAQHAPVAVEAAQGQQGDVILPAWRKSHIPPVSRIPVHACVPLRAPRLPGIEFFPTRIVEPRPCPSGIVTQVKLTRPIKHGEPAVEAKSLRRSRRSRSPCSG